MLLLLIPILAGVQSGHRAAISASVRLVNGPDACSGRVEVLYGGQWGTVCDDIWDVVDAMVVCRELRCGEALEAKSVAYFGGGSGPILMDDVHCVGTEISLLNCVTPGWGVNNCGHSEDAGVVCKGLVYVRLVDGGDSCSGRVEVLHGGHWGTVSDNGWDLTDAGVLCAELGCGGVIVVKGAAYFGAGLGQVWMDAVQCNGTEDSVLNYVKLVSGPSACEGRLELLNEKRWGAVCFSGWDLLDASVVCQELGCGDTAQLKSYTAPAGAWVWMSSAACTGNEGSIRNCPHSRLSNCVDGLHAGVSCQKTLRRCLVRIVMKPLSAVNFNDLNIKTKLINEVKSVLGGRSVYSVTWRTQADRQIFHKQRTSTGVF